MGKYRVVIPNWLPMSLNKLIGRNPHKITRIKKEQYELITAYCLQGDGIPKATGKRRITLTITLGKGVRSPDEDNMWKILLDGLVNCGRLKDDNRQNVERMPIVFNPQRAEQSSTTIELEDL